MSDRVIFPPRTSSGPPGWSVADLNDIRLAVQPLDQLGVDLETGWGVSDEGDPWFTVTAAATGELIVHVTRLNAAFTAIAPALGEPLHARDLATLVRESVARLLRQSTL